MEKAKRRRRIITLVILLAFILTVGVLLLDSNTRIVTTEYELFYADLPVAFDGFRIVLLADIHVTEFGNDNERLIRHVRNAQPDVIAIAGDLLCAYGRMPVDRQLEIAGTLARGLAAIAPVYFVTGNHEWDRRVGGPWALFDMFAEYGVTVLRNQYEVITRGGDSIIFAGVDDPHGPADMITPTQLVERIFTREGEDSFVIMLEHRNNNLQLYSQLGVRLVLCGHAHGGIVRLPFTEGLIGPQREWFPTYTGGVYTRGGTNMVVSRGLGSPIGLRFLNNPQIVAVTLRAGS